MLGKVVLKFKEAIFPPEIHQLVYESQICNALWRPTTNICHDDHIYVGLGNDPLF